MLQWDTGNVQVFPRLSSSNLSSPGLCVPSVAAHNSGPWTSVAISSFRSPHNLFRAVPLTSAGRADAL